RAARSQDHVGCEGDDLGRVSAKAIGIALAPADVDEHVVADGPARLLHALNECDQAGLSFRVVGASVHQHADAPHSLARLLCTRRERPRRRRAASERNELAPPHSITSSARASSVSGTVRPSALAVLRLMTSSYLVGACTGRSAGFSPLKMRSI